MHQAVTVSCIKLFQNCIKLFQNCIKLFHCGLEVLYMQGLPA